MAMTILNYLYIHYEYKDSGIVVKNLKMDDDEERTFH